MTREREREREIPLQREQTAEIWNDLVGNHGTSKRFSRPGVTHFLTFIVAKEREKGRDIECLKGFETFEKIVK